METQTFKLNKWRLLLILVISVLFIMNGLTLLVETKSESVSASPVLVKLVGVLSLLFFGAVVYVISKQLLNSELGLTIDEEGIKDFSNSMSVGLIKWENVIEIEIKKVLWMKVLAIHTNNPEKYLQESKGLKLRVLAGNFNRTKTPIVLSARNLKISSSKLAQLIQNYWGHFKTKNT